MLRSRLTFQPLSRSNTCLLTVAQTTVGAVLGLLGVVDLEVVALLDLLVATRSDRRVLGQVAILEVTGDRARGTHQIDPRLALLVRPAIGTGDPPVGSPPNLVSGDLATPIRVPVVAVTRVAEIRVRRVG
jgi:hypothetical protein